MFKKKANIKSFAPLRSSDRRKLADELIQEFGVQVKSQSDRSEDPGCPESEASQPIALASVRNSLLPDNALSARFTTTFGPDLKQVSGILYAGAHTGEEERILWFRVGERMLPTVYTLWHNPNLIPLLHTPSIVVEKLQKGSPLMIPGLAHGPPFPQKATSNAIVAIASTDHPSVPLVVGICETDVSSLKTVQGVKGHAVRTEHWMGDELWSWSINGKAGTTAPLYLDGWYESEAISVTDNFRALNVRPDEQQVSEDDESLSRVNQKAGYNDSVEGQTPEPLEAKMSEKKTWSTKEIDNAFWQAFLFGVDHSKNKNNNDPKHGLSFPIPQSLVISNLVLPYLPIFTITDANALNIKKTSWKNVKKFMKALDKAKILKMKERDGGECVILDIDFNDAEILDFKPYKLPRKSSVGAGGGGGPELDSSSALSDPSIGQNLQLLVLYKPPEHISPLCDTGASGSRVYYLASELRSIVMSYVDSESLTLPANKRFVALNPFLSHSLFATGSALDEQVIAKGSVPRDALVDRVREACSPYHLILRNDEARETSNPKPGRAPKILVSLETRGGNKVITKVSGLERFHIHPKTLSDELQRACASSTSVGTLAGSSPKNPIMEVLVQGPQKDAVIRALQRRGVKETWIEVVDKVKAKGKKG